MKPNQVQVYVSILCSSSTSVCTKEGRKGVSEVRKEQEGERASTVGKEKKRTAGLKERRERKERRRDIQKV